MSKHLRNSDHMEIKTSIFPFEAKLLYLYKQSMVHASKPRVYILNDEKEQSLLGKYDGIRLGIVKLNPSGAKEPVPIDDECDQEMQLPTDGEHYSSCYAQQEEEKDIRRNCVGRRNPG